ncbi:hypothetical protein BIV59_22350 [Bacillus sp. MUM 13]|nr:hypothetical protein BIV59_22350 [Bacillus sp. MUM 13]
MLVIRGLNKGIWIRRTLFQGQKKLKPSSNGFVMKMWQMVSHQLTSDVDVTSWRDILCSSDMASAGNHRILGKLQLTLIKSLVTGYSTERWM